MIGLPLSEQLTVISQLLGAILVVNLGMLFMLFVLFIHNSRRK